MSGTLDIGRPGRCEGSARPRSDDRGVSPVIGAVLMFALALALLAILQTTAVPALNEQLEFQHNERVQTDMVDADAAIDRTGRTGTTETIGVETGFRYPPRMLFVNPPPVSGTVRTGDPGAVELTNARAVGETGDYWNGTRRAFRTRSLVYRANYNEYATAPTTVVEPWVVYDRFGDATVSLTEQDVVDGRRVSLIALGGDVSRSAARDVALDVQPTSASIRTVTVGDTGTPIRISGPTGLDESTWRELLGPQTCQDADNDDRCDRGSPDNAHVLADSIDVTGGVVTFELERNETYELQLGKVTTGGAASEKNAVYLTDVEGTATAIPENGSQRLVVEARNRFDNPVSGVAVSGSIGGDGNLRIIRSTTDIDGRAVFVYEAPEDVDGSRTVEVTIAFDGGGQPRTEVPFDVRVMDFGGATTDTESLGGREGAAPKVTITDVVADTAGEQDRYDVSVDARDPDGDLDRVEYELVDPDTGTVIDAATASVSGDSDGATRRLGSRGSNRVDEYRIDVTVIDDAGNTGTDETTVSGSGS